MTTRFGVSRRLRGVQEEQRDQHGLFHARFHRDGHQSVDVSQMWQPGLRPDEEPARLEAFQHP